MSGFLCSMVGGTFAIAATGNSVSFDGSNSYYSATGLSPTATDEFLGVVSISFYWNGGTDGQHLFGARLGTGSGDLGFYFDIQSSKIRFVGVYGNGTQFGTTTFNKTLKTNDWNHFTALVNAAYIPGSYGFLNGEAVGLTGTSGGTPYDTVKFNYTNTATTVTIGDKNSSQTGSGVKFSGKIRHVAFWSNITSDGYYEPTRFWNPANDTFRDLGTTGTASNLPAPIIYHYGDTTTFATNNGANFASYNLTANNITNGDTLALTTYRHARAFEPHGTGVVISTAQSKFGGSSLYVTNSPGSNSTTGSAIKTQEIMDFFPGMMKNPAGFQGYTLEGWVRFTSWPYATTSGEGASPLFHVSRGSDGYYKWTFGPNGSGKITFTYPYGGSYGATTVQESTASMSLNTWHHIALVIDTSSNVSLYVDGSRKVTATMNNPGMFGAGGFGAYRFYIGSTYSGYAAYVDEVRQSSTARYSGTSFTVPTTAFTHDSNTTLLMHFDGANNSTAFIDDNGASRTAKQIVPSGNAQLDTAQYKFGQSSALFDGTDDALQITDVSWINWNSDFTVELWIRMSQYGEQVFFDTREGSGGNGTGGYLVRDSSSVLRFYLNGTSIVSKSDPNITTNTWYHVAITRSGNNFNMWIDGTSVSSATSSATGTAYKFYIGRNSYSASSGNTVGHIDEFRFSNTARYTANFTPSTTKFSNDANTLLLLHMEGGDAQTRFHDDNITPS